MSVIGMNVTMWKTSAHAMAADSLIPYRPSERTAALSNSPKNPGAEGSDTPMTINPCTNKVADQDTSSPNALNPNHNANGWSSQWRSVHPKTAMKCPGVRNTLSPSAK